MIKCEFTILNDDLILQIQGHAEYSKGNDIVCAGVSALSYTLVGTLANAKIPYEFKDNPGDFLCGARIKGLDIIARNLAGIVFETICIGLMQIAKTYPNNVSVKIND